MAGMTPAWLGNRESGRLEYRSADSLGHPETIVRAVVGMLNASKGGHVVIGVDDGGEVHGVSTDERHVERLQQLLLDRIEPRPTGLIEVAALDVGRATVLELTVRRSERLHAERRAGMLGFWLREGAVTVPMPFEELPRRMSLQPRPASPPRAWHEDEALQRNSDDTVLVLQAASLEPTSLDVQRVVGLLDPSRRHMLQERRLGWSILRELPITNQRGKRVEVGERGGRRWTVVDCKNGTVRFEGSSAFLLWEQPAELDRVIHPCPIVEGTVTFFRLLAALAGEFTRTGPLRCELGIWHAAGWRLGPAPGAPLWLHPPDLWPPPLADDVAEASRETTWQAVAESPHREAYPLVRDLYEWFGFDADVPFWRAESDTFRFPP